MKKILLVRLHEKLQLSVVTPPAGFLYVPSYLRRHNPSLEFFLFDFALNPGDYSKYKKFVSNFRPDAIFFSGSYVERDQLYHCLKITRSLTRAVTICGGPLAGTAALELLHNPFLDYTVSSEGEQRAASLIDHLSTGSPPCEGIGYRRTGQVIFQK
ncbi:MAG: hypothetical protein PHQ23_15065, partial [Candidatus Wallbacteria bacterium]|nr:hypothetical protein [Candidatus Wallbacteria bacterium]